VSEKKSSSILNLKILNSEVPLLLSYIEVLVSSFLASSYTHMEFLKFSCL
jgi:hypothetical protein